jgi:hypothetical protein
MVVCREVVGDIDVFEERRKCKCEYRCGCKMCMQRLGASCVQCGWGCECKITLRDASRAVQLILGGLQIIKVEDINLVKQSALEWCRISSSTPHVTRRRRVK